MEIQESHGCLFFDGFWSRIARLGGGPVDGYVAPEWGIEDWDEGPKKPAGQGLRVLGSAGMPGQLAGIMTGQSTSNPTKKLS